MDEKKNNKVRDVNILVPEIGITFINFKAIFNFHKYYAQQLAFGIVKRSTKMIDGKVTYVIIVCTRHKKVHHARS